MSIISVLDKYIAGDFIGGNDILSQNYIDKIIDHEEEEIYGLLFDFRNKNLNFSFMDTISSIEEENILLCIQRNMQDINRANHRGTRT